MFSLKRTISCLLTVSLILSLIPSLPARAESKTKSYKKEGYTVTYRINSQWDNSQTITVTVTNTGTAPILNWAVKYETAGDIRELSNAVVYSHSEHTYILKNAGYNYEIKPKQSVNFNYTAAGSLSVPEEITLVSKEAEKQDGYDVQYKVNDDWGTGFQAAVTIENHTDTPIEAWKLSFDSNFKIQSVWDAKLAEGRERTYTIGCQSWSDPIPANASLSFGLTGSKDAAVKPELKNFKLTEVIIEDEINWDDPTDSDKDGLPDVYERNAYHTDPHNPDTDGDGLPDGYEVMTLRTEPASPDSDGNGTTDDKEDFDADGLSNYEEYKAGTDPYLADTDEDGLSDGEEISRYKTDPLKPDTDNDNVLDGDELLLELDPNDPETTDGIPDADAIRKQTLAAGELEVNDYNEAFKISIEMDAGNHVKRYLEQDVSPYSGVLSDNRAIVGQPVFLNYEAGAVSGGTITFQMDKDFISSQPQYYPELQLGMERYGIFCYDEEAGTLVPVACDYDDANSCIRTDFSNAGDLIVMDYEALLYDLGIEVPAASAASVSAMGAAVSPESIAIAEPPAPEENANESAEPVEEPGESLDDLPQTGSPEKLPYEESREPEELPEHYDAIMLEQINRVLGRTKEKGMAPVSFTAPGTVHKQVDLVFAIDTSGSMGGTLNTCKQKMADMVSGLYQAGITANVGIVTFGDYQQENIVQTLNGSVWAKTPEQAEEMISRVYLYAWGYENHLDAMETIMDMPFRSNSVKFAVLVTDEPITLHDNNCYRNNKTDTNAIAKELKDRGILTCVVSADARSFEPLYEVTGGIQTSVYGDFHRYLYDFIIGSLENGAYFILMANSLVSGFLAEPLSYDGTCDTDGDGLPDREEVDWSKITVNADGSYTLPLWSELCQTSRIYGGSQVSPLFSILGAKPVIPAVSNPFSKDSDNDYYPDLIDKDKLKANPMYINDKALDDTNFHDGQTITEQKTDIFTDGNFDADQKNGTARYVFTRKPTATYQFVLTPKKEGFYRFSGGLNMDVKYSKGALFWKQTVKAKPEPDGTYLLKKNVKYTITMRCVKSADTDFTARQDNWVYAPNGGLWTIEHRDNITMNPLYSSMFISPKLLVESTCKVLPDNNKYEVYTCYTKDDIDSIMANLTYSDPAAEADFKDAVNNYAVLGGAFLVIVSYLPGVKEYVLVSYVIDCGGKLTTGIGLITWLSDLIQKYEDERIKKAIQDGNLSIRCSHFMGRSGNSWDVWKTPLYINKYQLGNRGQVKTNITTNDVKNYCGW